MPMYLAWIYVAGYLTACLAAALVAWRDRATLALLGPAYRAFLLRPWKVATFAVAALGLVLVAPYTGDFTWDYVDAGFMAALTFATAPWAVGVYYLAWKRRAPATHVFVALCAHLFSASWSYDLWLLHKFGTYPETWLVNLIASTTLYVAGGLFWNLDWDAARGQVFAFWDPGWPAANPDATFGRVALPACAFMGVIATVVAAFFVGPYLLPYLTAR